MRVLITGAAGEFGRDLAPWLAARHDVRATDILPVDAPYEFVPADLREPAHVAALAEGMDAVIHLAVLLPRDCPTADFVDVNTKATTLLCEAAAAVGVKRFVYISTVWASGHGEEMPSPVDEHAPWLPLEMYGLTKLQGELSAEYFARMTGMSTLVLRMCGYERSSEIAPDGSVDLDIANLALLARDHLRTGQKICNPNDLGAIMEGALAAPVVGFDRVIVGNDVPWTAADAVGLVADPGAVYDRYFPGAQEMFAHFGVPPAPVGFFYNTDRGRKLLGLRHQFTVADIVAHWRRRV